MLSSFPSSFSPMRRAASKSGLSSPAFSTGTVAAIKIASVFVCQVSQCWRSQRA